jgi:hypothetical protein
MNKPTIYEALSAKLGRPATDRECNAGCRRILGMRDLERWAIYCESDTDLAWSNADGWIEGPHFDLFTRAERDSFRLPMGGVWRRVA